MLTTKYIAFPSSKRKKTSGHDEKSQASTVWLMSYEDKSRSGKRCSVKLVLLALSVNSLIVNINQLSPSCASVCVNTPYVRSNHTIYTSPGTVLTDDSFIKPSSKSACSSEGHDDPVLNAAMSFT